MSLAKDMCERPKEECGILPIELAPPKNEYKGPAPAVRTWQSTVGNSSLALAAAAGPPPNRTNNFPFQLSFGNAAVARTLIQRKEDGDAAAPPPTAPGSPRDTIGPVDAVVSELIVEDAAQTVTPAQMKKTQFLAELRTAISGTVAEALAHTAWTAAGCPYIDRVFTHFATQNSERLERTIRRYAPEARDATTATELIRVLIGRVRGSLNVFLVTGRVPDLPEGAPSLPTGVLEACGGAITGLMSGIAATAAGVAAQAGSVLSDVGNLFLKERGGGDQQVGDPQAVHSQLQDGQTLDAGLRSRMEGAFGESFSGVQVHTEANAAQMSESLNARAFTVGNHVAFARGEYLPGTLVGDALIAHELAHVVQQRGMSTGLTAKSNGPEHRVLEEDADESAVGAIISIWGGAKSTLKTFARHAKPSLRSGLGLQRCKQRDRQNQPEAAPGEVPNYDSFCDPNGYMTDGAAGLSMARNWRQLERVYQDAASNNVRAVVFIHELEEVFANVGVQLAETAYSAQCSTPVVKEFSRSCHPNWAYLDFLRRDQPGGVRLRQVVGDAYAQKSRSLRVRNSIIINSLQVLMAGVVVRGALSGVRGAAIAGEEGAGGLLGEGSLATEVISGFSAAESAVIAEARQILASPEFVRIRAAQAAREALEVKINGRTIIYEPDMNASGMTLFGDNGFVIGREAFASETELTKTILHEVYRLSESTIRGTGTQAGVAAETDAAANFAERAAGAVTGGR